MQLTQAKIKQLELIASKFKVNPDLLVDVLLEVGLKKKSKTKNDEIKKKTPEQKVKAIEEEALDKGWTYEQLWAIPKNTDYSKKGLIYFVKDHTTIGEIKEEYITLMHERPVKGPVVHIFENKFSDKRPWVKKIISKEDVQNQVGIPVT